MSDFKISRYQIKQTHELMELVHDLLEQVEMSDDVVLKQTIDDHFVDLHYQVRDVYDRLLEETNNKAEVY